MLTTLWAVATYARGQVNKIMTVINSFQGEYFFLSNFFYSPVEFEGEIYPAVEHAFQAAKTFDLEQRKSILQADSPALAKHLGARASIAGRLGTGQV